ncbi:fimbrial biogenesis outer membrane usher protein [Caulobacter hibisci]|uniref:Fimbrial biogenesis outer membrane usher protein n=1 Tax=Caulobacter hibisci TaxID=2035993 RepID=A0ABS0T0E8_9CAUL|nr:fimbrial biogenesis outer membrane usher protein [Caulobacter hibisci]MBI1684322.1 fimbrial biogenesis outer membrane usher protein [Caulobacter hibisci]
MRLNSRQTKGARSRAYRRWLLAGCLVGATPLVAPLAALAAPVPYVLLAATQEPTSAPSAGAATPLGARRQLNPTGRDINLTVPLKEGDYYLGDMPLAISADGQLSMPSDRLLGLLAPLLDTSAIAALRSSLAGRGVVSPEALTAANMSMPYDPRQLELRINIPPELKAVRSLQVAPMDRTGVGAYVAPAEFSGYLNIRGSIDYVEQGFDEGFGDPTFLLDSAMRLKSVVFENEAVWQPGASNDFQRLGTRFVYDDVKNVLRWTAGDLQAVGRGFQSAPDMAGLSIFRSYSVLQPQTIARPRGRESFTLARPSDVSVILNNQLTRRLRLDPGRYNVRDFPFAQGANDVRLVIEDDTGRRETLQFNVFFDRSQLDPGLSEFGLFAGVKAPLLLDGPDYTEEWTISGFYRRGITDRVTLGVNGQADDTTVMAGFEGLFGTRIGTLGVDFALSHIDVYGSGYAAIFSFQRLFQFAGGRADALNLSFETRSREFGPVGTFIPDNRYNYEIGVGYSHAFSDAIYASFDGRYSAGRDEFPDASAYRVGVGYRLTSSLAVTANVMYDDVPGRRETSALISLSWQFSNNSSLRAEYDGREDRARIAYQTIHGQGVGSYNAFAEVSRSPDDSAFNGSVNYIANRAELGLSHFQAFEGPDNGRTSMRVGTSIGFADGAVSVGRPVYDSFAIVKGHKSLKGADVVVNPTPFGYSANSGALGTALETGLSAYAERTITVDAQGAPAGYDLGSGSFRMFPPYRAGYRLEVGSDYSITAIGRMVDSEGQPLSLVSGQAVEVAKSDKGGGEPITLFTNRVGRFGASGLRPGRWRLEMGTTPPTVYYLDVPASAEGFVKAGDLKPAASGG